MITRNFMFRSAQLMSSTGELRPGYLNADSSGFEGEPARVRARGQQEQATVRYHFDKTTGRMVRS